MSGGHSALLDRLPHRPPFRFVTQNISIEPGVRGDGEWFVQGNEVFLTGHFPGNPIVPGVLIAEALAKFSGLVIATEAVAHDGRLAHLDVRFVHAVVPPARIRLESLVHRTLGQLVQFEVIARSEGQVCARGSLTLAIVPGESTG
jgi:3-hydroxyacyl-[acyl-carrier-protein] dehydratase